MERPYLVIDAFPSEPFSGNAAAVVLAAEGLDDARMQSIAAEFNLSETTFVLAPTSPDPSDRSEAGGAAGLSVRFRWFTPTVEVDMCGHATIAGVHALVESGRLELGAGVESATVRIDTRSGMLSAFVERIPGSDTERMIWLDLVDPKLVAQLLPADKLASILKLPPDAFDAALPTERTQDRDVLVFVKDFQVLSEAKPDFARLGELLTRHGLRGLCLATVRTPTPSIHVQSRFFAPTAGVDEDPVTGSVHGPLAVYLVKHGQVQVHEGLAGLSCVQGKPGARSGLVNALVQEQGSGVCAVRIGGRAVTTMRGTLTV